MNVTASHGTDALFATNVRRVLLSALMVFGICLLLSSVSGSVDAYEDGEVIESNNLKYKVFNGTGSDPGTAWVIGVVGTGTNITVPSEVEGYVVTTIVSMTPSSVRSVILPDTVHTIEERAFSYIDSLESILLGDGLTSIGESAFEGSGIRTIEIPDGVSQIGMYAFAYCLDLEYVSIGASFSGEMAMLFSGSAVNTINVSGANEKFRSVGGVVYSKDGKTLVYYPPGSDRTTFTVPEGTESMSERSFHGAYNLESVVISDGIGAIGPLTFYMCPNLREVIIGKDVSEFDPEAIVYCQSLAGIFVSSGSVKYFSFNGVLFEGNPTKGDCTLVRYPSGHTATSYTLPHMTVHVAEMAFFSATHLTHIELNEGLESIGVSAFRDALSLENISIPSSLDTLDISVFTGCLALRSIEVSGGSTNFASMEGVLYNKDLTKLIYYPAGKSDRTFEVPDTVSSYGPNAFIDVFLLQEINFGSTLYSDHIDPIGFVTSAYSDPDRQVETSRYEGTVYLKSVPVEFEFYLNLRGGQLPDGASQTVTYTFLTEPDLPVPTKDGVLFLGWYLIGYDILDIIAFSPYTGNQTISALWVTNSSWVSFDVNGGDPLPESEATRMVEIGKPYGDLPVPVREGYTFDGWYTDAVDGEKVQADTIVPVTGNHKLYAHWTVNKYLVHFISGAAEVPGSPFEMEYGATIVPPESPTKDSTPTFDYEFVKWSGFTDGMRVTGEMYFCATFSAIPRSCPDAVDGNVTFDSHDTDVVTIPSTIIEEIKSDASRGDVTSVTVKLVRGTFVLDRKAIAALDGNESFTIFPVTSANVPEPIAEKTKGRPVFEVSIGSHHGFEGGKVRVSLQYVLGKGESAENLRIWHFNDDGTYTEEKCSYDPKAGAVEFTTDSLSYFSIVHVVPEPSSDEGADGPNVLLIAGIVAGLIAVLGVAFLMIRRRA